ncbi:MAG: hypothetical protein NDJ19_14925 [Ramlibacter sp.]|nr:hypothetical protein [Ramlibacter sp.]
MNTAHVEEQEKDRTVTTADAAEPAAGMRPEAGREAAREQQRRIDEDPQQVGDDAGSADGRLAALFPPEAAGDFRARWDTVQIGFVDDPRQAVRQADELVAQVMKSLAESFAAERARFEGELDQNDSASTENLRVALRRYRSFFQRLLSL